MYIHKPSTAKVNAYLWNGSTKVKNFPDWFQAAIKAGQIEFVSDRHGNYMMLNRTDGVLVADIGDYIVAYPGGNLFHIPAKQFEKAYQLVS